MERPEANAIGRPSAVDSTRPVRRRLSLNHHAIFRPRESEKRSHQSAPVRSNDQHRRGGDVERVQLTDRNVPRMKRRLGTIAGPRSCSSMILGLDSFEDAFAPIFPWCEAREHRLRWLLGPRTGRRSTVRNMPRWPNACGRLEGTCAVCDAHDAPLIATHAASIKSACFGRTSFTGPFVQFVHGLAAMRSAQTYLRII